MTVDILISNVSVYITGGWHRTSVSVSEGKIVSIDSPTQKHSADRLIDGSGLFLSPGLIDSHVHLAVPGMGLCEDFECGTRAAAAGGVTMVCDMPNTNPLITSETAFNQKLQTAAPVAAVNFGLWAGGTIVENIPRLLEIGALGIKIWTVTTLNPPELTVTDDATLFRVMSKIAECGALCMVHPSSHRMFTDCKEGLEHPERTRPAVTHEDDFISETITISTVLSIARFLKSRVHIAHVRSKQAIALAERARFMGQEVSLEANPKYIFLRKEDETILNTSSEKPWGLAQDQADYILGKVYDGTINIIATDHAPIEPERISQLSKNTCMWSCGLAYPGGAQIEHFFSLLLDNARMDSEKMSALVRSCSENPAKLLGLYPTKGAIAVGSDADLTLFDPKREYVISAEKMHSKLKWTIYEGRKVKGKQVMTIVNGKIAMEDGEVTAKPGSGLLVRGNSQKVNQRAI